MREKMKNEWQQWQDGADPNTVITPDKPKRSDTTEFV